MFDINDYGVGAAYSSYAAIFVLCMVIFRRKYNSLLDPLVYILLWASSILAFLIVYIIKRGLSVYVAQFLLPMLVFLGLSYVLLKDVGRARSKQTNVILFSSLEIWGAMTFLALLQLVSFSRFIAFARSYDFLTWFAFRSLSRGDYSTLERLLGLGSGMLLIYFCFYAIIIRKRFEAYAWFLLLSFVLLDTVSGGRSSLVGIFLGAGAFLFFHRREVEPKLVRRVNKLAPIAAIASIMLMILVTSVSGYDLSLADGAADVMNRLIANADGLHYYLTYHAEQHITSSPLEYFKSVFGIYFKYLTGENYKNVGWQLNEMVKGQLDTVEGTNFILPLQAIVFGQGFGQLLVVAVTIIFAKLRSIAPASAAQAPMAFYLVAISYMLIVDVEYFVYQVIAGVLVYLLLRIALRLLNFGVSVIRSACRGARTRTAGNV